MIKVKIIASSLNLLLASCDFKEYDSIQSQHTGDQSHSKHFRDPKLFAPAISYTNIGVPRTACIDKPSPVHRIV